jgi:hypothetical protein
MSVLRSYRQGCLPIDTDSIRVYAMLKQEFDRTQRRHSCRPEQRSDCLSSVVKIHLFQCLREQDVQIKKRSYLDRFEVIWKGVFYVVADLVVFVKTQLRLAISRRAASWTDVGAMPSHSE